MLPGVLVIAVSTGPVPPEDEYTDGATATGVADGRVRRTSSSAPDAKSVIGLAGRLVSQSPMRSKVWAMRTVAVLRGWAVIAATGAGEDTGTTTLGVTADAVADAPTGWAALGAGATAFGQLLREYPPAT